MQRVDGDGAAGARYAGAYFLVGLLLVIAEEHVAMIDLAFDADDIEVCARVLAKMVENIRLNQI